MLLNKLTLNATLKYLILGLFVMKKLGIILISITIISLISGNVCEENITSFNISNKDKVENKSYYIIDEWTGNIRIEGKSETIWDGEITIIDSNINAENASSGLIETYYLPYPSILGALDEASTQGGFSYYVIYYPDWNAFYVQTISEDSDWWHYWIDYELPMVGAGKYELTDEDNEILWGYLENWEAHNLKITIDKQVVKKNEEFTVSVFNESDSVVKNATVFAGSHTYFTDINGNVTIKLKESGSYEIYSEKNDFVRSEKVILKVKTKSVSKNILFNYFLKHFTIINILKKLQK